MGSRFARLKTDTRENDKVSGWKLLSYSGVLINDILPHMSHFMTQVPPCLQNVSMRLQNKIDVVSDYDPIMYREKANLNTFESLDMYKLPQNFTYDNSGSLKISHEVCTILNIVQPTTIGQAQSLQGITPTAINELKKVAKFVPSESLLKLRNEKTA